MSNFPDLKNSVLDFFHPLSAALHDSLGDSFKEMVSPTDLSYALLFLSVMAIVSMVYNGRQAMKESEV